MNMIDPVCKEFIKNLNVNCFVETGTDKGETVAITSRWFSELDTKFGQIKENISDGSRSYQTDSELISYPVFEKVESSRFKVHSVDLDEHSYKKAKEIFKSNENIHLHRGSSETFLQEFLAPEHHQTDNRYLFFLDAHWGKYWPLRAEIKTIAQLDIYLIVIDDFLVPGKSDVNKPHGEFGFDLYGGRILDWAYICDLFERTKVKVFHPKLPNRDRRGWVLITHGYKDDELHFLKELGLFEMDQDDEEHKKATKATLRTYLDLRNLLKTILPISLLRNLHRYYERKTFH